MEFLYEIREIQAGQAFFCLSGEQIILSENL